MRFDLARSVVVGVGNPLRGDDGFGPALVAALAARGARVPAIDAGGAPEERAEEILAMGVARAVVFDCATMGLAPGELRIVPAARVATGAVSTHRLPIGLFVELLTRLGGVEVLLAGAEPASTGLGDPLSGPVRATLDRLVRQIAEENAFDAAPRFPEEQA